MIRRTHPVTGFFSISAAISLPAIFFLMTSNTMADNWSERSWHVECEVPNPCEPADDVYEQELGRASRWMDGLGFKKPTLAPNPAAPGKYFTAVNDEETIELRPKPVAGIYNVDTHELFLAGSLWMTIGSEGQPFEDESFRRQVNYEFVPVHELFHAVQQSYQDISDSGRSWIWEGMAEAIMRAYADRFESSLEVLMKSRYYTMPLHEPGSSAAEYATWLFWHDVGHHIGSSERVAYFHDVLKSENLTSNKGLDGVDGALPGGLYQQLPRFFARVAQMDLEHFKPGIHTAVLPPGVTRKVYRFPLPVREVAGQGARVAVSVATTETVQVNVSIEPDLPELHLIHEGQVLSQGEGDPRNRYRDELHDGTAKSYEFVIANVAQTASKSVERKPKLVVELEVEEEIDCCSCQYRATEKFAASEGMPCDFEHPAGWETQFDRHQIAAVAGPPACGKSCPGSPGMTFMVARKADRNADTMEQIWHQMMKVAGSANCGGQKVTFFSLPGADPNGPMGGLRFYIGHGAKKYGANATFQCTEPGEWLKLQELFIDSFRTNGDSTFVGE